MPEEILDSWEAFSFKLKELRERQHRQFPFIPPNLLFRGQSNSRWRLATTLERYVDEYASERVTVDRYYRLMGAVKPQIDVFTEKTWELPPYPDIHQLLEDYDKFSRTMTFGALPGYDYMAYLRHHGFPSPLLDWTQSPFIAAYFAFCDASSVTDSVSIFVYLERPKGAKGGTSNAPQIHTMGHYVRTHARHFLQRSEYSLCLTFDNEWLFESHETVFARDDPDQDLLWKFNLPTTERLKVMKLLDDYNLNAYSLFGSEESLMSTMAMRELVFR